MFDYFNSAINTAVFGLLGALLLTFMGILYNLLNGLVDVTSKTIWENGDKTKAYEVIATFSMSVAFLVAILCLLEGIWFWQMGDGMCLISFLTCFVALIDITVCFLQLQRKRKSNKELDDQLNQ